MTDITTTVDTYLAAYNETDEATRKKYSGSLCRRESSKKMDG